jgi:hypothetical protein
MLLQFAKTPQPSYKTAAVVVAPFDQNDKFAPTWTIRGSFCVELTFPNVAAVTPPLGLEKLAWFHALKNSPRTVNLRFS